jgi:hypothetical protein
MTSIPEATTRRMGSSRGVMQLHQGTRTGRLKRPAARPVILAVAALLTLTACGGTVVTPSPPAASSPTAGSTPTQEAVPTPETSPIARIAIVPCPTVYASPGESMPPLGDTMTATVTATLAETVTFYSNGDLTILGPKGWDCAATAGADGTGRMAITPPGQALAPPPASPAPDAQAVTAVSGGSCIDCIARMACPFFPEAARLTSGPCGSDIPADEIIRRPLPRTVVFEDLPGVTGTGQPSGGRNRALGFLVYSPGGESVGGSTTQPSALQVTCTLPESMSSICDEIIEDR